MIEKIKEALREIDVCETWEQPENKLVCSLNVGGVCRCEEVLRSTVKGLEAAGWKVVPVEPTSEMRSAGNEVVADGPYDIYGAMLAVAPKVIE